MNFARRDRSAGSPANGMLMKASAVLLAALLWPRLQSSADDSGLADWTQSVAEKTGIQRGVISVLGADPALVTGLVEQTDALVHVREPDAEAAQVLHQRMKEDDYGISRVIIEQGALDRLPYADHLVDMLVTARAGDSELASLTVDEILRVLRPDGTAVMRGTPEAIVAWTEAATKGGAHDVQVMEAAAGSWLSFRKPPLADADDWSHWEHRPDNNPVSNDKAIRAPYMTQFLTHPMYIGMPSITTAAGGRTFLAVGHIAHHRREWDGLNRLIARNGYNGTILWERRLPEGYLVHRSAFIATPEIFYMIDGNGCLLLDAATGREVRRLELRGVRGEWKYMAMQDGMLYVMAGKKERGVTTVRGDREFGGWSWADLSPGYYGQYPFGFGDTIAAYDLEREQVRWMHREESLIDSRSLALRDGRMYFMCPDAHLRAINADNGEVLWTNGEQQVRELIAEPGKGLTSTPGFKTQCLVVATPEALIIQGQTRMNVVAVSTSDGAVLWTKRKVTNNPNALYLDGKVILGVGPRGSHQVIDPVSGNVEQELPFFKRACTRLTATDDSLFCRGEGTLRFDRASQQVLIDGAARPACNDGALPANGMLYIGPWQCDCNLSLIGSMARCSAGDFEFDITATNEDRLVRLIRDEWQPRVEVSDSDWSTYRGDLTRSGATPVSVARQLRPKWRFEPESETVPTPAVSAGDLIYWGAEDGVVRAVTAANGELAWAHATGAPIKSAPTIWSGRIYVGSGNGYVSCLDAASGDLLWRFRAAPTERYLMLYDRLTSTWPVNSGIAIHEGVAYFGAGMIDHDGTYLYAVDAKTGELIWENNKSGHWSEQLRKGVSVQGNLTVLGDQLLLAGGNQISPAPFDLADGTLRAKPLTQGQPKANNGRYVGSFLNQAALVGGRVLYSAPENVATKGSFVFYNQHGAFTLNYGGVPPAWDDEKTVLVNFRHGGIMCFDSQRVLQQLQARPENPRPNRWYNLTNLLQEAKAARWETNLGQPNRFEAISLAVAPQTIVAVVRYQDKIRSQPTWHLVTLNAKNGSPQVRQALQADPLPGGLLVDRRGQVAVSMIDGSMVGFGGP